MFKFPIGMNNVHIGGGEGGVKALISNFSNFSSLIGRFLRSALKFIFFQPIKSVVIYSLNSLRKCLRNIASGAQCNIDILEKSKASNN